MDDITRYDEGLQVRREVLGDAHVTSALAGQAEFNAPFQDFITQTPGERSRSVPVFRAILAAC